MQFTLKRIMDVLLSLLALVALYPFLIIIALAIKLDSKGPILFTQDRLGQNGRVFSIYKFRTMVQNAEHMGNGLFNYEGDFRVTRVGKILRKTSMDEVPQLLNILKGEMSIVGPRPPVTYEHGNFKDYPRAWKKRFTVRPGVTGWAQINGRNELSWEGKIKYDDEYIDLFKEHGIRVDVKIMYNTVVKIFSMTSVYERRDNASKEVEREVTTK